MSFRTNRLNHQQIINNLNKNHIPQYSQANYGSSYSYKDKPLPSPSFIDSSSYLMKEEILNRINDKVEYNKGTLCIYHGSKIYLNESYENILTIPYDGSEYNLSQIILTTKSNNNLVLSLTDKNGNSICEHVIKPDTSITKLTNFNNQLKELNMINFNVREEENEEGVSDIEEGSSFKTCITSVNVILTSNSN